MEEINQTAKKALAHIMENATGKKEDGDYVGKDGLLYCGKCHTRKERFIKIPSGFFESKGGERKVPVTCKCQEEERVERERRNKYEEQMLLIRRYRDASMMESKYRNARFEDYIVTDCNGKVFQMAKKYAENFEAMFSDNQGIIFFGPVGTGKSFTAACIANSLLDRQIPVIMTSFVKILQNTKLSEDEAKYIEMLNRSKLLILDDLGTERSTDYALEKVYNVVDSRSRASKPMILTTNMSLNEMLGAEDIRYKRIYDRIFETCLPLEVSGESFRRISAEQRFDRMAKFMEG